MSRSTRTLPVLAIASVLAACGGGSSGGSNSGGGGGGGPQTPSQPTGAAADCPAGLTDAGLVAGGTLRACQLPVAVSGNLVLAARAGTVYAISGRTQVGTDAGTNGQATTGSASLTIEPGVRVFGSTPSDSLIIARGSRLFAEGTATSPIVFTSRQNIDGLTNETSQGQWGGVVIAGRAPHANCIQAGPFVCTGFIDGTAISFGGDTDWDNSGRLRYIQIRYAGGTTAGGTPSALTLGGVGTGTTIDNIQIHNSATDGLAIAGGTVLMRHILVTGADDDGLDADLGWSGGIQFAIVTQRPTNATSRSSAMEMSSNPTSIPRASRRLTSPTLINVTLVGRDTPSTLHTLLHLDTGADPLIAGTVLTNPSTSASACLDIADMETFDSRPTFAQTLISCRTAYVFENRFASDNVFNVFRGTNRTQSGVSLTAPVGATITNQILTIINGPVENSSDLSTPGSAFFERTEYAGAVTSAATAWYRSWTCGLGTGGAC